MKTQYGFPLVDADNIFSVLQDLGIVEWPRTQEPVPFEDYIKKDLSQEERHDLKYALQSEVVTFQTSRNKLFRGFRIRQYKNGVSTFTLLPGGLLPVCAEFRHGCEEVSLNLPSGVLEQGEDLITCAKREFEDETGIVLKDIISLSTIGTPLSARLAKVRNFSFIGIPTDPLVVRNLNLESEEYLATVLIPLEEWIKLIYLEKVDSYSVVATSMALINLKYRL